MTPSTSWLLPLVILLASCGGEAEPEPDPDSPEQQATTSGSGPLMAVSLGEKTAGFTGEFEQAFSDAGRRVRVMAALGSAMVQANHVQQLVELGPDCLVIQPVSPLLLQQTHRLCQDQGIPLLVFGHGETSGVPWVGVGRTAGGLELGQAAARLLQSQNVEEPRILVVEDRLWPETGAWVNEVLDALEGCFESIHVLMRVQVVPDPQDATERIADMLPRLNGVDLLIGADDHCTRAVIEGYRTGIGQGDALLLGRSSDPQVRERVSVPRPSLLLLSYSRATLLATVAESAIQLATGDVSGNAEIAYEILGPSGSEEQAGSVSRDAAGDGRAGDGE